MSRSPETRVGWIAGWLDEVYALDLELEAERFLVSLPSERVRQLLPEGCRSGVLVIEEHGELHVGLHLDPADRDHNATVIEETSHLVCLAWHAARDLPVSQLVLELQAEIDRFLFARLRPEAMGDDAFRHFERYRWAEGLEPASKVRYEIAHERGHRYCRKLDRRFPRRSDTPSLLAELRRFYRASPETKLRAAA